MKSKQDILKLHPMIGKLTPMQWEEIHKAMDCYLNEYKAEQLVLPSVSNLIEVNHAYIEDADQIGSYDVTGRVDRLWITSKEFDSIKDIAN